MIHCCVQTFIPIITKIVIKTDGADKCTVKSSITRAPS